MRGSWLRRRRRVVGDEAEDRIESPARKPWGLALGRDVLQPRCANPVRRGRSVQPRRDRIPICDVPVSVAEQGLMGAVHLVSEGPEFRVLVGSGPPRGAQGPWSPDGPGLGGQMPSRSLRRWAGPRCWTPEPEKVVGAPLCGTGRPSAPMERSSRSSGQEDVGATAGTGPAHRRIATATAEPRKASRTTVPPSGGHGVTPAGFAPPPPRTPWAAASLRGGPGPRRPRRPSGWPP